MRRMEKEELDLRKNDIIDISITDMGVNGEGIGRYKGFAFFVKNALPGDTARAVVTKINKGYGFAKALEILSPSPDRVEPPCPLAGKCGGCQIMGLSYKKQLEIKESKVWNDLSRIGKEDLSSVIREPVCGMEMEEAAGAASSAGRKPEVLTGETAGADVCAGSQPPASAKAGKGASQAAQPGSAFVPLRYRNKVQLPVGLSKDGRPITGFYAGRTHFIIEASGCPAAFEGADLLTGLIRNFIEENHISVYDEKTGRGLVRHILLREGHNTGQIMVCLVINGKSLNEPSSEEKNRKKAEKENKKTDLEGAFVKTLKGSGLNVASVSLNINTKKTNVILGEETILLYGKNYIEEKISDLTFRISPLSFFQVNTVQAEKLYAQALKYAALTGEETVWDLYCGTGTISLFLAKKARKVYGAEIVPEAVEDARKNAEINGISNAEFLCGKAEEIFPEAVKKGGRADAVVLDPPRKGCEKALLEAVLAARPSRIVYISCGSATLARDIGILSEAYELKRIRCFDMFPHTVHMETAALLELK